MAFLNRETLETMGFKRLGQNVLISEKASIYRPSVIEIGSDVRIDDFCILSPGDDGISIGNFIHIGCQSTLIGRGHIKLKDYSNISSKVSIYSSNDDYSGEWMTNPMVPTKFTNVTDAPVVIGKHTIIGASSVILPGVTIGDYCSVGSLSLVKESIEDGWIVAGSPCRKIKKRSLKLKELENELIRSRLDKPLLSVAISSYKFADYIEECVKSFQNQITNFDFEIVIADDFSEDGTMEILKKISLDDPRVRILDSDKNLGPYENIKRLFESCNGKYISHLDGDDFVTDINKLQIQVDFLESNPDYVLHSTSYKYLENDGSIVPSDGLWFCPMKDTITQEEICHQNLISFGRTFRNIPNLLKDWMKDIYFLDWAINFELLKYGKAFGLDRCTGMYRITKKGMITSINEDEIQIKNKLTSDIFKSKIVKPVVIIDSFVHNQSVENKLIECLDRLKEDGFDVILVSNTKIKNQILNKVDHFLYDDRNQLFSDDYTGVRDVDLWKSTSQFEAHEIKPGLQRHGLSVLINMFNSLEFAKSIGYTHFFRLEVDDDFGPISRAFIKNTKDLVSSLDKKGLFYFNEGAYHNGINQEEPNNVSFHFMYCEIDLFLNNVWKIKSEDDYKDYLMSTKGNLDFEIAEEFVYNNILKWDQNIILKRKGLIDLGIDFPDTNWNQIVSESNTSGKFRGCTSLIYQVTKFPPGVSSISNQSRGEKVNQLAVFTYNYKDREFVRTIDVIFKDGRSENIKHEMWINGSWSYNIFGDDVYKIRVYENNEFLYEEYADKSKNYIVFK